MRCIQISIIICKTTNFYINQRKIIQCRSVLLKVKFESQDVTTSGITAYCVVLHNEISYNPLKKLSISINLKNSNAKFKKLKKIIIRMLLTKNWQELMNNTLLPLENSITYKRNVDWLKFFKIHIGLIILCNKNAINLILPLYIKVYK